MSDRPSRREQLLAVASVMAADQSREREMARSPEASQIRAGRALLNWSGLELAKASGLTVAMVGRIEAGASRPSPKTMNALREAFGAAGVILILEGEQTDEGLGVRLRKAEP